jgi:hypothetical protein
MTEHNPDMASQGRVPPQSLTDKEVAARLPILIRTPRGEPLSGEQLQVLIDSIRRAEVRGYQA